MDFPANLRRLRKDAGLTQEQLAERCGWSGQSRVSNYEGGRGDPAFSELPVLAKALGVGVAELFAEGPSASRRASQSTRINPTNLASSIEALRQIATNLGVPYDPVTHPEATAAAYELSVALGAAPSQAQVIEFGAAVAALLSKRQSDPEGTNGGRRKVGEAAGGGNRGRAGRKH